MVSTPITQFQVIESYNTAAKSSGSGLIRDEAARFDGFAVVVFTEQTGIWWLRGLRPGFRHCCLYRALPAGWLLLDPLSHRVMLQVHDEFGTITANPLARALEFAARLRLAGHCALTLPIRQPLHRLAPPLPFSCVEMVKRVIGIQSWIICTPWQLFCELRKYSLDDNIILAYISKQQEQIVYIPLMRALLGSCLTAARRLLRRCCSGRSPWVVFSAIRRRRRRQ